MVARKTPAVRRHSLRLLFGDHQAARRREQDDLLIVQSQNVSRYSIGQVLPHPDVFVQDVPLSDVKIQACVRRIKRDENNSDFPEAGKLFLVSTLRPPVVGNGKKLRPDCDKKQKRKKNTSGAVVALMAKTLNFLSCISSVEYSG